MPIIIDTPPVPPPSNVVSAGPSIPVNGGMPIVYPPPIQIMGMTPFKTCTAVDCRRYPKDCCYENIVFGNIVLQGGVHVPVGSSTYENDFSTFLFDYGIAKSKANASVVYTLEKCDDTNTWVTKATLNSNTYGTFYPLRGWTSHPSYSGYSLNWAKVLNAFGVGCYRVKIQSYVNGVIGRPVSFNSCQISESFRLWAWDCNIAHGTTKFEFWKTAKMGDASGESGRDGQIFDLCNINWFYSIRLRGFFGKRHGGYEKVIHEYQNTKTTQTRNQFNPMYKWISGLIPFQHHLRLQTYGMMADTMLVSDYNRNNPDQTIVKRFVRMDGDYKPVYYDEDWQRKQSVEIDFNLGYRSVVSSVCCDPPTKII